MIEEGHTDCNKFVWRGRNSFLGKSRFLNSPETIYVIRLSYFLLIKTSEVNQLGLAKIKIK